MENCDIAIINMTDGLIEGVVDSAVRLGNIFNLGSLDVMKY